MPDKHEFNMLIDESFACSLNSLKECGEDVLLDSLLRYLEEEKVVDGSRL
jgi:hypothetical protein